MMITPLRAGCDGGKNANEQHHYEARLLYDIEAPMLEETDRQIDNDRARVTRHRLAPGTHTGFHRHEFDYVVVPVTPGRMRILEGGEERFSDLSPGVRIFPAGRR